MPWSIDELTRRALLSDSMKTVNRERQEFPVLLFDRVGPDAWGTEFGAKVFGEINLDLIGLGEGTLVCLDYAGLERVDVSFQREAIVETLRKHRPRLLFVAVNLSDPDILENLSLALDRRGECLLIRMGDHVVVLGKKLAAEQMATLKRVWKDGEVTSSDFESDAVKLSTASSRLSALWKAGLIERLEGASSTGGREHRYFSII